MTRVYDCNAWQSDASIIPPNPKLTSSNANDDHRSSYFYVRIVADFSTYLIQDQDEEEEDTHGLPTRTLEQAENVKAFEIPAGDLLHEGTCSSTTISDMLSAMEIPEEAHPDMAHRIGYCARAMAKDSYNVGRKVLPMIVHIFVEDYVVDDDHGSSTGGDDFDDSVSEESEEAVEMVKVEDGLGLMD